MKEKVWLLLPKQEHRYQVLNVVYEDVYTSLVDAGLNPEIIELSRYGDGMFHRPELNYSRVRYENLPSLLKSEGYFLGVDDFEFLHQLEKVPEAAKVLIWAQYFRGHKFLFDSYTRLGGYGYLSLRNKLPYELLPRIIWKRISSRYVEELRRHTLIAQSLYTALLLNRVYSLECLDFVYIPVVESLFRFHEKKERVLFFSEARTILISGTCQK
ncbi:MAG: hypothetical protein QXU18_01775 [Thermoplasmatales archaeon]